MRTEKNILARIDWLLVLFYFVIVTLGWFNIYAAGFQEEHGDIFDLSRNHSKQLLWIFTALLIGSAVLLTDSRFYTAFAFPIYGFFIILLVALFFFGREVSGSRSWFSFGPVRLQPSEFAKFATALALAKFLSIRSIRIRDLSSKVIAALITGLPVALVALQPDVGSALMFFAFMFVLYREGLSGNILLTGLYAAVLFIVTLLLRDSTMDIIAGVSVSGKTLLIAVLFILAGVAWFLLKRRKGSRVKPLHNRRLGFLLLAAFVASFAFVFCVDYVFEYVLNPHQRDRINELLAIKTDPKGTGYNVNQSMIAIGSGGMWGKGFLNGTQTKYEFVPEQSTDFIFCTIGEEWGFAGSMAVVVLYLAGLLRIVQLAEMQRSDFTRIYGYGVASILFFHFAVNIGMAIGLAPVIGIPLPFFSYGGSSLWGFTILLFIFIKLDAHRLETLW